MREEGLLRLPFPEVQGLVHSPATHILNAVIPAQAGIHWADVRCSAVEIRSARSMDPRLRGDDGIEERRFSGNESISYFSRNETVLPPESEGKCLAVSSLYMSGLYGWVK